MEDVVRQLQVKATKITTSNKMDASREFERELEDVDYWRKRSGWFDDDESKLEYNSGVYDTYYNQDGEASGGGSGSAANFLKGGSGVSTFLKITAIVVAIALVVLIFRATQRKSSSSKRSSNSRRDRSDSSRRSRSKSASGRSRSRSRKGGDAYNLMEEEASKKSGKSSRSRSRRRSSSRTSSRSKSRSKSKSKSKSKKRSEQSSDALV